MHLNYFFFPQTAHINSQEQILLKWKHRRALQQTKRFTMLSMAGGGGFGQKQISARSEGGDQQARFVSEGQKENHKQKQRFFSSARFETVASQGWMTAVFQGGFSEPVARVSLFPVPTTTALQRDGRVTQKKGNKSVGNLNSIPLPPAGVLVRLWRNLAVTKDAGLWGPTAAGR